MNDDNKVKDLLVVIGGLLLTVILFGVTIYFRSGVF
jgi:hypothetical protein